MSEHKDIDKFFQQRSAQHDFEYNPDAWAEMEILLNKEERSRRFWWWLSGFLVVGLSLFVFFYGTNEAIDSNSVTTAIAHTPNENVSRQAENIQKDVGAMPIEEKKSSDSSAGKNIEIEKPKSVYNHSEIIDEVILPDEIASKSNMEHLDDSYSKAIVGDDLAAKKAVYLDESHKIETEEFTDLLPIIMPLPLGTIASIDGFSLAQKVNVKHKIDNQWLVGAFLASEISSVELETISKNNFRFGGQTSFRFKRKIGVGIGLSYTHKKYKVNEGDYTPPKGFWTRKIAPQSTQATTDILEVPVILDFFPKGYLHNGLYTNLGLTSYFMLKEQYQYSYDLADPDLIREWHTEKENEHWFGVGQVSVGYQRVFNPKVSAQFGPYVHVPLTGIGHGNVSLWSFGIDWKMNFLIY